ncbi:hypothetical protein GGR55DRAFT_675583 [Xylaria sp. FL0064]|nr:hypothetical protein GGR55DRAFT_675583 [Xylaria sp. FL0064]
MQVHQGSSNGAEPREKDWDEVKADIAKLVEAIDTLASSKAVNPKLKEREWRRSEFAMQMFRPTSYEVFDHLLDVFLSIFLRDQIGRCLLAGQEFGIMSGMPSFTDQLELRLAMRIQTQNGPGGIQNFSASKLCREPNQLKAHIKATEQWKIPVPRQGDPDRLFWRWPAIGKSRVYTAYKDTFLRWQDLCTEERCENQLDRAPFVLVQVHFRSFTVSDVLQVSQGVSGKREGLACERQLTGISSLALGVAARLFIERRISILGVLSTQIESVDHACILPTYRVTILSESGTKFPALNNREDNLKWWKGFDGIMAFQTAVLAATEVWETEWANTLDAIDDRVQFQLHQTMNPIKISEWMFDADFERSRLYFTLLQVLRIFGDYIRTVSDDLDSLSNIFLNPLYGLPFEYPTPDELRDIKGNWEMVIRFQKDAEQRLLARLSYKTEEIKSLRDGLFSATSLRESNRSATMNRYVIIFTVVTVLFLPPTFTSTVFALDFFKKDDARQTTWEFKVTTVVISLATYITAGLCVLAVNWKHIKARLYSLWPATHGETEMGDKKGEGMADVEVESAGQEGVTAAKKQSRFVNMFGLRSRRRNAGLPL